MPPFPTLTVKWLTVLCKNILQQFIFWGSSERGQTSWGREHGWASPLRVSKTGFCVGNKFVKAELHWGTLKIWLNKQNTLNTAVTSWNPVCHCYGKVKHTARVRIFNAPFFHAEASSHFYGVSSHTPAEQQQEELTYSHLSGQNSG